VLLRAWANFSDCGFSRRVFLFRQEFSFSQSYRFFPSFCQALAEDRVTTPTKKKKKKVNTFFGDFSAAHFFLLQLVNNQLVHDFLSQQNIILSISF